jgi:hypothetical protein
VNVIVEAAGPTKFADPVDFTGMIGWGRRAKSFVGFQEN